MPITSAAVAAAAVIAASATHGFNYVPARVGRALLSKLVRLENLRREVKSKQAVRLVKQPLAG